MEKTPAQIHERIRVGGVKLSQELAQFIYSRPASAECFLTTALGAISHQQINITFLSLSATENEVNISFCVDKDQYITVQGLLDSVIGNRHQTQCIPSVGTLTIFPHRNSLRFIGKIIQSFSDNKLPIYGLCTSISALSINTDYSLLEHALRVLQEVIELPENHAPLRQEFNVRQINL
jgi:aspartokinase